MPTISILNTPIATPLVNPDGTINAVWNEFFVRFMTTAGITVSIDALEADLSSLQDQVDNIDPEVSAAITMSDSDSNSQATLNKLYDGNKTSDGISYTVSGTDKYIQYEFGVEDYIDRLGVWTSDANGRIYVGYSTDGTTWTYLKAESDHTLDSNGRLVSAASQAAAALDYFQLAAGTNIALFPDNTVAKYVRLFLTGSYTTTIYELIFARMLIAEMATISSLSAVTADLGVVTAGTIRDTNSRMLLSLDDATLKVFSDTITIEAGVNDDLDWKEDSSTYTTALTAGTTYTPTSLAAHVQTLMRAAGDSNTTVTYSSSTKKITIANSTLTTLELLWDSGTNAATTCGRALGFDIGADDTGALTYTSDIECALRVKIGDLS